MAHGYKASINEQSIQTIREKTALYTKPVTIPSEHVGVVYDTLTESVSDSILETGTHEINSLLQYIILFNTAHKEEHIPIDVKTKDQKEVHVDIILKYQLNAKSAPLMVKEKFSEDILTSIATSFTTELASKIDEKDLFSYQIKNLLFHTFLLNADVLHIIFDDVNITLKKSE